MLNEKIYDKLKKVPEGRVTTYKLLGKAIRSKAYRQVGKAMKENPYIHKIPCHRVVRSDGNVGGFALGVRKKIEFLKREGVVVRNNKIDLKKYLFKF